MSGGVDSSVAAALLVEQGYDVVGVTLRIVPDPDTASVFETCCSLEHAQDAARVAERLGFPHMVLNYLERFEEEVIADFIAEYRAGRTPNPCVRCNALIKFGALAGKARELEADFVATGHYARVGRRGERGVLRRARHGDKDQSYVLACLSQEQLAVAMFPLGDLAKAETRAIAHSLDLDIAGKSESQEICFVPDDDYRRFLTERVGTPSPGPILSVSGEALGEHKGLPFYTIGQRKGLGIAAPRPYYVVRLDPERNAVVVGHEEDTYAKTLTVREVNWGALPPQTERFDAKVKIRYRHEPAVTSVEPTKDGLTVEFVKPQRSVTPGQWAVLYDGDDVLAGGIIEDFETG
jgi:tRNA-uridine 2-sulfurtransferase